MQNPEEYKDIVKGLSQLRSITPREQLKTHFESTLISSLPNKQNKYPLFGYSFRLAVFMLMLFLLGGSGIVLAADNATPGSLLYPVKQIVQEAKLVVVSNPTSRALLNLEKAEDKVEEIKQSAYENNNEKLEKGTQDYQEIVVNVINESQIINNQESSALNSIVESLGNQTQTLQELQNSAPINAQPALENAIEVSQKGLQQVQDLQIIPPNQQIEHPDQSQNGQIQGQNTSNEHNNK